MHRRMLIAALTVLLAAPALAAPRQPSGTVKVSRLWATPALAGRAGGGYLSITNGGKTAETLLAAASPAAERVTLHQMQMAGSVMRMRALGSLTIAPGATVTLAPGGYHLMLEGLKRDLKAGDRIPAVLTFARAGNVRVTFVVQAAAPMEAGHGGHM